MRLDNGEEWECKRCGKCCQGRGDMTDSESPVIGDCPHLSFDEKGLACCDIYDYRPDVCAEYPNHWAFGFKCERMEQCEK